MLKLLSRCSNYVKPATPMLLSSTVDLLSQQTRTTFILKRKFQPRLRKKNASTRVNLKSREFIYELVEDTNTRKREDIKVVMVENKEGFGPAGTIIRARPLQAYQKLLLPKVAVYATPENTAKYATQDLSYDGAIRTTTAEKTEKYLSTLYLIVNMSLDTQWEIKKKHVRIAFRTAGVHVPEDAMQLPLKPIEGPNLDLQNKQFYVTVTIDDTKEVKVRCIVNHYTSDPNRKLPHCKNYFDMKPVAVFPEDQEALEGLPKHIEIQKKEKLEQLIQTQ